MPMTAGSFFQPFTSWKKSNPPANATRVLPRRRLITTETSASGCVKALTGAVHDVDASATLDANLETKHIRVASTAAPETLAEAMRDAGFTVTINA